MAKWIYPATPGSSPKHTIYAFIIIVNLCDFCHVKGTKLNKKRRVWPIFNKQKIKNVDFEASAGKAVAFNIREICGSNPAIGNFIYCQLFFNPIISKNPKWTYLMLTAKKTKIRLKGRFWRSVIRRPISSFSNNSEWYHDRWELASTWFEGIVVTTVPTFLQPFVG